MSRDLPPVGPSGVIARVFQNNHLTPLLALLAIILGVLAVVVVGTGVVGDPLWLSLSIGLAVGGAFAGTSLLLRRVVG